MDDPETPVTFLYDGLTEAVPWSSFLQWACGRFDALACSILFQSGRSAVPVASFRLGGDSTYRARYWSKLFLVDPFTGLPPDTPITFASFSEMSGRGASSTHRFLSEIASPHILGVDLRLGLDPTVRLRITRSNRKPDFAEEELAALAALVPHMKRAFALFLRLTRAERECEAFRTIPDLLGHGAMLVDCDGSIVASSAAARALLARGDGLSEAAGRIIAGAAAGNAALQGAIRSAEAGVPPRIVRIDRGHSGLPLAVVVSVGAGTRTGSRPARLLLLLDPDRIPGPDHGALAMLLGLTPAEAALAMLLGQGLRLDEAASALGVRMTTVRAQLRAIFAKTGVTRQSELVRIVLNYSAAAVPGIGSGRSSTISRP